MGKIYQKGNLKLIIPLNVDVKFQDKFKFYFFNNFVQRLNFKNPSDSFYQNQYWLPNRRASNPIQPCITKIDHYLTLNYVKKSQSISIKKCPPPGMCIPYVYAPRGLINGLRAVAKTFFVKFNYPFTTKCFLMLLCQALSIIVDLEGMFGPKYALLLLIEFNLKSRK